MGWPVVTVTSGGIAVTDNTALGWGVEVDEAANGMGTAITYVTQGGLAVIPLGGAATNLPPGYQLFLVQTSSGVFQQFAVQTSTGVFDNFAVKVS